ncbi:hypothetical protein [Actinomadura chokoriensis]|uniref:hypothetical protein n=1 Tax=Actinomadura chokoriensis TaxID=454156 RepID=UPI0031F768A2
MADNPDRPVDQAPPAPEPAREAAHARTQEHGMTRTEPGGDHRAPRVRRSLRDRTTGARRRTAGAIATAISVVTTLVVLILAVHIVFVAFEANTANDLVRWFGDRATDLCWQFKDVFQPADHKTEVAVNYGLAALVYLVIGRALVGLVRRLD